MLIIYGSDLCPDCVNCKADLDKAGVAYEYRSITEHLPYMKEFLAIRDKEAIFAPAKEGGSIGIPCILDGDRVNLDWEGFIK
jgi:glutaredoxin-related protein